MNGRAAFCLLNSLVKTGVSAQYREEAAEAAAG